MNLKNKATPASTLVEDVSELFYFQTDEDYDILEDDEDATPSKNDIFLMTNARRIGRAQIQFGKLQNKIASKALLEDV